MSYTPKTVKGKMNFKNVTDKEIMQGCSSESEVEVVRKFYNKLDGAVLVLSLWDYDNCESYHLTSWQAATDKLMMDAMFILENEFGIYSDFEEFKKAWNDGEYDAGGSIVFPLSCVEELEVICEESNELSEREKLKLLNSMDVEESSSSCGECEYIVVKNNEVNMDILHKLGITDKEIIEECNLEDDLLDISSIAGRFASHFNPKNKLFYNEVSSAL